MRARDVRDRPRPHRLRRAHRHDARPARGLRDVLELRRGRPPLRADARRHARGAAQARPAVRPHRARAPLRAAPVRDRRALRPRPDAGRDVQAAQRLRARRARRALAHAAATSPAFAGRRRAGRDGRPRGRRGDRRTRRSKRAEERRLRPRRRRARLGQPRPRLPDGGAAAADARGDRASATPSCSRRCASTRTSAGCSCARQSTARSCSARAARSYLDEERVEGEDPLARFSPTAAQHLLRTDGFAHVADIMVGSFYDPVLDEGCAFEELISFHGGLGGPQTRGVHPEPEPPAGTGPADPRRGGGP